MAIKDRFGVVAPLVTIMTKFLLLLVVLLGLLGVSVGNAKRITNKIAVFEGLDKITGRTRQFDVAIDGAGVFGSVAITPRVCYTHSRDELQKATAFVQIVQLKIEGQDKGMVEKIIFSGWFFASSPGLNALDHPVYDIWLVDCKDGD